MFLQNSFLLGFLISLLIATLIFRFLLNYGRKTIVYRYFYDGSKRWGGVALGLTVIISLFFFQGLVEGFLLPKDFWSLIVGISILLIGGIWDDKEKLNWKKQLFFQSAAAFIAVFVGDTIDHVRLPGGGVLYFSPFFSAILAYFWIILVVEALNWLDGVDGLSGSISLISLFTLAALGLSKIVNQPSTTLLSLIVAGALLSFLFFNFPPAKVFLGSSGIWILGFLIAVISIYSGGKVATTALVLAIPIIDFIFVSLERILAGKLPVFGGDRLHLHERLVDLGWSSTKITLTFSIFSLILGIGALLSQTLGKLFLIIPIAGFFLFFSLTYQVPHSKLGKR